MPEKLTLQQLRRYSFEKIKTLQNKRFEAVCKHILPMVPFYKRMFSKYNVDFGKLKRPEDWKEQGLPLIKKITYMKNPKDFIVQPSKEKIFKKHLQFLYQEGQYGSLISLLLSGNKEKIIKDYYSPKMLVFSGGTESNNPTPMLLTGKQKFELMMNNLGMIGDILLDKFNEKRKTGMNLFPYAPHLGWHAVHHGLDINCDLNLCTAAGKAMRTENLVRLAGELKPNVICGMNDYLRNRFLQLAIEKKIRMPKRVIFLNGAQKMLEPERDMLKKLARKLGVEEPIVIDLYSASELKEALLPELFEGSGFYHLSPLSTIIRTVSAKKSNEEMITEWDFEPNGYIASWNIDGGGSVLHGYLIGDKAEAVIQKRCEKTGLNVQRFYNINRIREAEAQLKLTGMVEEKIKGTRVNLVSLRETALKIPEIKEAQVVVGKNKEKVIIKCAASDWQKARAKLREKLTGYEIKVTMKKATVKEMTGNKLKFEPIEME